jgi:hypothetical protein
MTVTPLELARTVAELFVTGPWWFRATATFLAMTALDFVWARYTLACAGKHAMLAATSAVGIYGLNAFLTIIYVHDNWMIVPLMCGAFIGTWASIRLHKDDTAQPHWPD